MGCAWLYPAALDFAPLREAAAQGRPVPDVFDLGTPRALLYRVYADRFLVLPRYAVRYTPCGDRRDCNQRLHCAGCTLRTAQAGCPCTGERECRERCYAGREWAEAGGS